MSRASDEESVQAPSTNEPRLPLFVPAWIRRCLRDLKGPALSVLMAYSSHANRAGLAYPSIWTLQRETGYGTNAVKRGRALLVGMGLLIPKGQERPQGRFGRKIFQVVCTSGVSSRPKDTPDAAPSTATPSNVSPCTAAPKQGQEGSPMKGKRVTGIRTRV